MKEKPITKEEIIEVLDKYYKEIKRTNPPKYQNYTLKELKMCLQIFNITLTREIN
jgi:hypothetical protein